MPQIGGQVGASAIPSLPFSTGPRGITLPGAASYLIPAGRWMVNPGHYTELQQYDQFLGTWRKAKTPSLQVCEFQSDGSNWRLFNTTGCPIGAMVTNGGTSYTTVPTVTCSAGGSLWQAIVGGSINTTVTVTTAGLYNYIPTLVFSEPLGNPNGTPGVRASGFCVMAAGAISSVTVVNAGAGYTSRPTITIVPDPRETATQGGVLTVNATLANAGVVTAVVCMDPGASALTTLPTLTVATNANSGTQASATALMNWTVTGYSVAGAGSSLGTSANVIVSSIPVPPAASASGVVDPQLDLGLQFGRDCRLLGYTNSTGGLIASNTSLTTLDAGWGFYTVPSLIVNTPFFTAGTVNPTITATVGATTDTSQLQRIGV